MTQRDIDMESVMNMNQKVKLYRRLLQLGGPSVSPDLALRVKTK